jgi:uncharacterized membrane protein YkvA (DUF1232 family)
MTGKDIVIADPKRYAKDQARVREGFWRKARRYAGKLPFLDEAIAGYYAAVDPRTPLSAKTVLFGALAYFVLPIDMLPDFIASLGFTDDAAVIFAAVKTVGSQIKDHHRTRARAWLSSNSERDAG